jgi:hypothetical protein
MTDILPHLPWIEAAAVFGTLALAVVLRALGGRRGLLASRVLLGLALVAALSWVVLALRDATRLMA